MPRQIHFAEKAAGSQTNSSPFRSGARTGIRKSAENKAAGLTDAALQDKLLEIATGTCLQYDQGDDWAIPETDENGNSSRIRTRLAALTDINEMPDITSEDSAGNMTLSREGMDAVKRELLQGRGVTASCHAEAYVPGRRSTNYYFNLTTGRIILTSMISRRKSTAAVMRSVLSDGMTMIPRRISRTKFVSLMKAGTNGRRCPHGRNRPARKRRLDHQEQPRFRNGRDYGRTSRKQYARRASGISSTRTCQTRTAPWTTSRSKPSSPSKLP